MNKLTSFDLEELFLRLRSKSVGETVDINLNAPPAGSVIGSEYVGLLNSIVIKLVFISSELYIGLKLKSEGITNGSVALLIMIFLSIIY